MVSLPTNLGAIYDLNKKFLEPSEIEAVHENTGITRPMINRLFQDMKFEELCSRFVDVKVADCAEWREDREFPWIKKLSPSELEAFLEFKSKKKLPDALESADLFRRIRINSFTLIDYFTDYLRVRDIFKKLYLVYEKDKLTEEERSEVKRLYQASGNDLKTFVETTLELPISTEYAKYYFHMYERRQRLLIQFENQNEEVEDYDDYFTDGESDEEEVRDGEED